MFIDRMLPEFCYSHRELQLSGVGIHYLSAINVDPERAFDIDTNWNLLIELNRPKAERGPLLERIPGRTEREADCYASYHLLIDRDGNRYQLVPWDHQAYHAGVSSWHGRRHCNRWMAGIALLGTYDSGFTDAQYEALVWSLSWLRQRHVIQMRDITGHEHIAPGRKKDPGPLFDWQRVKSAL